MKEGLSFAERWKKAMREAIAFEQGKLELRTRKIKQSAPRLVKAVPK